MLDTRTPESTLRAALALLPTRCPGEAPLTPYEFFSLLMATGAASVTRLAVYDALRDAMHGPREGLEETRPTVEEWLERSTRAEQVEALSRAAALCAPPPSFLASLLTPLTREETTTTIVRTVGPAWTEAAIWHRTLVRGGGLLARGPHLRAAAEHEWKMYRLALRGLLREPWLRIPVRYLLGDAAERKAIAKGLRTADDYLATAAMLRVYAADAAR